MSDLNDRLAANVAWDKELHGWPSEWQEALDRIEQLEALCQQALVVIRQGVDEVFKLEFDKTGTCWDPGGFLTEAQEALDE